MWKPSDSIDENARLQNGVVGKLGRAGIDQEYRGVALRTPAPVLIRSRALPER